MDPQRATADHTRTGTSRVVGLFTAPVAGEPMMSHRRIELIPGVGIAGDRYALGLGHWSDPKWPDQQVTFVEAEVAAGLGLAPEELRRNIAVAGVQLTELVGRDFHVGGVRFRGVRQCEPCAYIESLTRPGILKALRDRGGLRAAILSAGTVAIGDELVLSR
ncbi:MAG: MOSC domain-containing protein [Chloroflexi bacterium]|nr:MOSC domain-containing protein [Chloroflexota bacterium]